MDIFTIVLILFGLCLFESINSIDNAIINAQVLSTMGQKARKWFLLWGLLIAVFMVRGLLPWLIIWFSSPGLGPIDALTATFSNDPHIAEIIEQSAPLLLLGAGVFLFLLFLNWIFLEEKHYGLPGEKFIYKQGVWFFAFASVFLAVIVWFALKRNPLLAFSAVLGSTAFFITHGFKSNAEQAEKKLVQGNLSDVSKLLYLEVIDATFSIDGVLGAFAFTLSVPLIILGNGLGALIVRQLTMGNIERIKKYVFLKNGAMYSILILGVIMILDAFGYNVPVWLSPIATLFIVVFFFWKSGRHLKTFGQDVDKALKELPSTKKKKSK